jgi:hypothetical protein
MKASFFLTIFAATWLGIFAETRQAGSGAASATDWLTLPSTYTHDPMTGNRVNQFAQVDAPPMNDQSRLITSGYTNYRSTIQVGQSADNYHRVDQWGPPVRPYGEWLFPYRPFGSPYEAWGAPFAGLNLGFGGGFNGVNVFPGAGGQGGFPPQGGFPGQGFPGQGFPGQGFPGQGFPGQGWFPGNGGIPGQPINPFPPGGAFPNPPWFDGYHPDYPVRPRLNDRQFFWNPGR